MMPVSCRKLYHVYDKFAHIIWCTINNLYFLYIHHIGDELALKVFEAEEDHETLELGTMREISILRILRGSNSHSNIVRLLDIQDAGEEGDCGDGNICMAMPLYKLGDLKNAVKKGVVQLGSAGRKQRVDIAHGLLSAVAFLHDNHIIHRDIKSDNVMITVSEEDGDRLQPVLIDFSLAKFVDGPHAVLPPGSTHTGKSVLVLFYDMNSCVQYKVLTNRLLHLTLVCPY